MAYIQQLDRQDIRRYRFRINTSSVGTQNLGPLPEGWDALLFFWPMTLHFALGDSTWLIFPVVTVGANGSNNNIMSTVLPLPNTVGNQNVRIPNSAGAAASSLIATGDDIRINVAASGSVSAGGDGPFISMDIVGYWDYLAGASVI